MENAGGAAALFLGSVVVTTLFDKGVLTREEVESMAEGLEETAASMDDLDGPAAMKAAIWLRLSIGRDLGEPERRQ